MPDPALVLSNASPMLRQCWHAVATAEEVTERPRQVWLVGEAWVVLRLGGRLVGWRDRCPHRLAPLSIGTVCGEELQCAYHGWRFGADGHCRAIPALGEGDHLPRRADPIPAWGIEERYGLIWLAPEAPICPLPEFGEWEAPGFDRIRTSIVATTVSVAQLVDNFLDASHFPFVHASTFGDQKAALVVDDGIERDGWMVRTQFSTWYRNFDDPLVATGEHAAVQPQNLLKQGSASMTVYLRLFFPVTGATLAILFSCQPETAGRSRVYKLVARDDVAGDAERIAQTIADEDRILEEDLAVLTRYTAMELQLDPRVEVHTKGDRLSVAWRRVLADWARQGDGPVDLGPQRPDEPTVGSPLMPDLDEHGRPEPPLAADETATLLGFLDYQRATLAWKCSGLDAAGLAATVGVSSMTLGGMLKHLAYVEQDWFSRSLYGRDRLPPWDTVDWKADPDWEWHSAAEDTPDQLLTLWQDSVARSRSLVADALAEGGLERLARRTWPDGSAPSLRWILVHMIEEYARHNGHADLLRESVDGLTGE